MTDKIKLPNFQSMIQYLDSEYKKSAQNVSGYELLSYYFHYPLDEKVEQTIKAEGFDVGYIFENQWANDKFEEAYEAINFIDPDEWEQEYGFLDQEIKEDFHKFYYDNVRIVVETAEVYHSFSYQELSDHEQKKEQVYTKIEVAPAKKQGRGR